MKALHVDIILSDQCFPLLNEELHNAVFTICENPTKIGFCK